MYRFSPLLLVAFSSIWIHALSHHQPWRVFYNACNELHQCKGFVCAPSYVPWGCHFWWQAHKFRICLPYDKIYSDFSNPCYHAFFCDYRMLLCYPRNFHIGRIWCIYELWPNVPPVQFEGCGVKSRFVFSRLSKISKVFSHKVFSRPCIGEIWWAWT